ncbi:DUF803 domain membrane protein [Aspergillus candidus]|uniref:DUF803 domain membrane protein n=1 Tax=Aspergillus candidus TaxID=41067 RepID=A0A2I2FDS9_ASPCN|nr:DUF803 domain membrane protein [Aspergillus candidus]PLB38806.1 DUF803 domain membrane protein [Aspergillus candidus]
MDFNREVPLAAGLLTALVSSAIPTPTLVPHPSLVDPLYTPMPTPGHDGDNSGGGHLHKWSSLIGICTALVGNVLISLALNIQRYAHIRIDREWTHEKLKHELDWKRSSPDQEQLGSYGATSADDNERAGRGRAQTRQFGRYRDMSPSEDLLHDDQPHIEIDQGSEDGDDDADSQHRMRESFLSDRTARPGEHDVQRQSYLRSPYWWAGIILMCLGEVGNFMAYGFAPASIVSPLGVVALISNCVIAPFMLKEQFRKRDFWGVIVAVAGAVVVVLSAKSSEEKIGPHDIWVMITRWEFELYLGLTAALIVGLMWASGTYGQRTILIDVGLVALFGGYTALSTKGVSSLLSFTLWHVITFPITYLLAFVLIFSALMQIRYINRALQRFDSTQVIPTQFVLFTLSVIVGSAILYQDFRSFTPDRAVKFVGGCLLTFLGVYFITSGRVRSDDESSYAPDDEEEAIGLLAGGERYRDRVDLSPPVHVARVLKPGQKAPELHDDDDLRSPPGSLLSREVDEHQHTSRGAVSPTPSSPVGSLTAESLTQPSPAPSSPMHPQSFFSNPWADSARQAVGTPRAEPQIHRPTTPPAQSDQQAAESSFLLRFPPAPGSEARSPQATNPAPPRVTQSARGNTVPQTPPAQRLRASFSSRFSPGTILPTISAGFSAVVAESLRRGEMSPVKERRSRHRASRGKQLSTTNLEFGRDGNDGTGAPGPQTDASMGDAPDPRFALATARLHSTGHLATEATTAGHSTPVLPAENVPVNPSEDDFASGSRFRSFSDSWSGGLNWLGGALHRPNDSPEPQATTQTPSSEHGHPANAPNNDQEPRLDPANSRT